MGTFSRSLALTKQSWSVLRANPQLALFPLVSGIVTMLVMASFAVPAFFMFINMKSKDQLGPEHYALMFAFYMVSYFVVIFFNSGLVSCAYESLGGRPASFNEGMRVAFSRIGSIFVYALIAATIGMILKAISERAGIIRSLISSFLGFAWTLLTYFVVPILVVDNRSPVEAIKESGSMLKKTWGENITVNVSLNLIFTLLGLVAIIPLVGGIVVAGTTSMALGLAMVFSSIVCILLLCLISSTLTGVFQTALYVYARTGQLPASYDPSVVEYAFKQKKGGSNYPRFGRRDY
ncbi:MAG: hypothetical protein QOJ65_1945 [Fimbriimonadaceae bacterium]|jgi:hypothetical protein|nr:hypothetical protein [Fimbriimonadaceae bacterium]